MPSLNSAKELGRQAKCLSTLHNNGIAMTMYHSDNDGEFWPIRWLDTSLGAWCYFWGIPTNPVDPKVSPFMLYCDYNPEQLQCPSLKWGSYIPQAGVDEPTTTFGYNGWCLDPPGWFRTDSDGNAMPRKRASDLLNPKDLFVFCDSAMYWSAGGGVLILQNSTDIEPVTGTTVQTPTTHFRHLGKTEALCADGHAESFDTEGYVPQTTTTKDAFEIQQLGFVGTENYPHYDQD